MYVEADEDCIQTQLRSGWSGISYFHGFNDDSARRLRHCNNWRSRSWSRNGHVFWKSHLARSEEGKGLHSDSETLHEQNKVYGNE